MKIIVIEDEYTLAEGLIHDIQQIRPSAEIIAHTTNIKDSVSALSANPDTDIVFADIRIDDGLSFSVFQQVKTSAKIVFTTAYNEYALRAFEYNCADYLLKPIDVTALEKSFKKCEQHIPGIAAEDIGGLANEIITHTQTYRKRLFLEKGNSTLIVKTNDICYIYTEKGYTRVYMKDGDWGITDLSLIELCNSLNPSQFIRISRQCIVNAECVTTISPNIGRDYCITLCAPYSNTKVTITAERKKELVQLLDE